MWLRYQIGVATPQSMYFRTLQFKENADTQGQDTITLRKRRVKKITGTWDFWEVAIGMDVLYDTDAQDWIRNFWKADKQWLDDSNDPDTEPVGTWVEVVSPTGPVPFTYPTNNKALPTFSTTLYAMRGY